MSLELEVEIEVEVPQVEVEIEIEMPDVEFEVEAPQVEFEVEIEIEAPQVELELECDIQAPIVEIEIEVEAGGSGGYTAVGGGKSAGPCLSIIIYSCAILGFFVIQWMMCWFIPSLAWLWWVIFGCLELAALVFLVLSLMAYCKGRGGVVVYESDVQVEAEVGGNFEVTIEMPVAEFEYEAPVVEYEVEIEVEAPVVEFEVEIEMPEVEVEVELEVEVEVQL